MNKIVFAGLAALTLAGCGDEKTADANLDAIPRVLVRGTEVYEYVAGEYVKIPIAKALSGDDTQKQYIVTAGDLKANVNLLYRGTSIFYNVTISNKADKDGVPQISNIQDIQDSINKFNSLQINLGSDNFRFISFYLNNPTRSISGMNSNGVQTGLFEYSGSVQANPSQFSGITQAALLWTGGEEAYPADASAASAADALDDGTYDPNATEPGM